MFLDPHRSFLNDYFIVVLIYNLTVFKDNVKFNDDYIKIGRLILLFL